ncbi:MAG: hypothetical protein FWH50_01620, partial [Coriobacteriia bacterium]|nr:hypothetical protein [Coriobacteriia bacterium]
MLIRKDNTEPLTQAFQVSREIAYCAAWIVAGLVLGLLAKYSDAAGLDGWPGGVLGFIADLTSGFGIWIFLAVLCSTYSQRAWSAAVVTPCFFLAMLLTYYLYSAFVVGYLNTGVVRGWLVFAFCSTAFAYLAWHA